MKKSARLHACTIVARNYLALARVVSTTFLEHHPTGRFTVLLLDDVNHEVDPELEPFDVVRPDQIMPPDQFLEMAAGYNVVELATAVKPWLLYSILRSGASTVAYLDPDLCFYEDIDEVFELAAGAGIALTPHTVEPVPRDDRTPSEQYLLLAGVFNLGFIVVGEQATDFLDWWCERLRTDCIIDPANGLFVDQRWVDLVPGYFSHAIVRDRSLNVAYWNLSNRQVEERDGKAFVAGVPLRFFHFSGFDPDLPERLSKHDGGRPRYDLAAMPAVQRLCHDYAERLIAAGHQAAREHGYGLDLLPNGVRLDDRMRRAYREGNTSQDLVNRPPSPWRAPDAFLAWLREPGSTPNVSRYLELVYRDRPDVRSAHPDLERSPDGFLEWARRSGIPEERIPPDMLTEGQTARRLPAPTRGRDGARSNPTSGAVVAGYFRAEMGVGEAARRILTALECADVPHATYTYDRTVVRQDHQFEERAGGERLPVAIVCVNADQTINFARDVGRPFFVDRYTIGQWFWEVDVFPRRWLGAFDVVDEVWASSEHTAGALRPLAPVPVVTVPLPIEVPDVLPHVPKSEFGLEDRYTYLITFDFLSIFERKNPLGVVAAFTQAFDAPGEAQLVLKSTNAGRYPTESARLRDAIHGRPDIIWIDDYFTRVRMQLLLHASDAYVSLHRSEGFGLTMAEAMASGKPVVATAYSGNLEFMTEDTSILVPYELRPVGAGYDPYPEEASWAEPDVTVAAESMRRLFDDPEFGRRLGQRARDHVFEHHSPEVRGTQVRQRLDVIAGWRDHTTIEHAADGPTHVEHPAQQARDLAARIQQLAIRDESHSRSFGAFTDLTRSGLERLLYPFARDLRSILADLARMETGGPGGGRPVARVDDLDVIRSELAGLEARTEQLAETGREVEVASSEIHELRESVDQRLESLVAGYGAVADRLAATDEFKRSAAQHLSDLSDALAALSASFNHVRAQVEAVPYTAPGSPIGMVADPLHGDEALGFRSDGSTGDYESFEDTFRGPRQLIVSRSWFYVSLLDGRAPVLDVGCGRGELLEVLVESGVEVRGIDNDEGMVRACNRRGLPATHGEALEHLSAAEETYGAIVAIHVIEHLPRDLIVPFLAAAHAALRPGGALVLETVNPNAISALKTFWVDPTHVHPLFPQVALELARSVGFEAGDVLFPDFGHGEGRELSYNDRLVTQGEYALVAWKSR